MTKLRGDWSAWELAGLVPENGDLDRPLPSRFWTAPRAVVAAGDVLIWGHPMKRDAPFEPPAIVESQPGMLNGFIALVEADANRIAAYAQQWGILSICEHGLPSSHNPPPEPAHQGRYVEGCRPMRLGDEPNFWWEPLDAWWRFAHKARTILNLGAALHEGRPGRPEDWHIAFDATARWNAIPEGEWVQRSLLAETLNSWLLLGRVRPIVEWGDQATPTVLLGGGSLFSALATQLLLAVTRSDGLAFCSACGNAYIPNRRPKANQRRYCDSCRAAGAPKRDASRDYRRRRGSG